MVTSHDSFEGSAQRVRATWNQLSQTPWRDFYIASHAGWDDPRAWAHQAAVDVQGYLTGIDRARLASAHVLEIGCGVGRLAPLLASAGATYTGVDISKGMLEQARLRCAALTNARFYESTGVALPAAACDRSYGLIVAVAVFIHCPKDLIERNLRSAYAQLAPGGSLRAQVRVDVHDREVPSFDLDRLEPGASSVAGADFSALPAPCAQVIAAPDQTMAVASEALKLVKSSDYAGHAFRIQEASDLVASCAPTARFQLLRPALDLLYLLLVKPR